MTVEISLHDIVTERLSSAVLLTVRVHLFPSDINRIAASSNSTQPTNTNSLFAARNRINQLTHYSEGALSISAIPAITNDFPPFFLCQAQVLAYRSFYKHKSNVRRVNEKSCSHSTNCSRSKLRKKTRSQQALIDLIIVSTAFRTDQSCNFRLCNTSSRSGWPNYEEEEESG